MRVQQSNIMRGAAAAARAVQEVIMAVDEAPAAGRGGGGRGLYEGEQERPGRSELAYMQHKYTRLDSRIIIITAAILLLLLAILFLNFFIRWAIHRFFLLHSQKPMNPNKGLSKRQVQALPSFIYSSSKPPHPIFAFSHSPPHNIASPPCHQYPNFSHDLKPHTCHRDNFDHTLSCTSPPIPIPPCRQCPNFSHDLKPHTWHCDNFDLHKPKPISSPSSDALLPTKFGSTKANEFYHDPSIKSKLDEGSHPPPSQLGSTKFDKVDNDAPPSKFCSLEVDEVIEGNNAPKRVDEVANDASFVISSNKASVLTAIDSKLKAPNLTAYKCDIPIVKCTRVVDEMSSLGDDNASSPAPCPICLGDYADGDTIRVLPTCRHYFHIGCVDIWLAKNSSCPACRANILEATRTPIKQPPLQVQLIITTSH